MYLSLNKSKALPLTFEANRPHRPSNKDFSWPRYDLRVKMDIPSEDGGDEGGEPTCEE